ncbi:hypothetical protein BJX63DRAFT_417244, partial [Aspergillus granulosus]
MNLKLILENSNTGFFTDKGIKIGTALRFICNIQKWDKYAESRSLSQGMIRGYSNNDFLQNKSMFD